MTRSVTYDGAVDRAAFRERFVAAAAGARDFAREDIEEELPDAMRFRLYLNSSYDKTASSEFKLFPDDSSWARTLATKDIDTDGVVDVLWRDGYVPQWVDVQVASEDGLVTIVNVVACGRFTNNEARLYYSNTPIAPFSPKGPWLPARHVKGKRFSIYDRSACWSVDDLTRVGAHTDKVWSLALHGPAFSDAALARGPVFPRLEILELYGVRLDGEGLAGLDRFPRLKHLRARLGEGDEIDLSHLPVIPTLETLSLHFLPSRILHAARLAEAAPELRELTLHSAHEVSSSERVAFERLQSLTLELPTCPTWVAIPGSLRSLTLHIDEASDDDVASLLGACPDGLEDVGLRGTPVSNDILTALAKIPSFKYLDAVQTKITKAALEEFAADRPQFRCFPRLARDYVPVMSFEKGTGSILDADVDGLVNPVNCVGVMGKGLALAFKEKFPDVFREYERACDEGRVVPGRVHVVTREARSGPKVVFNFPTKRHWRDKSRVDDIESGLADLARQIVTTGVTSLAVPALGCGLGGLDWNIVRKLIVDHLLDRLSVRHDFKLVVFEPQ